MGFVAWLRADTPDAGAAAASSSTHTATELERHLQIVRSSRLVAVAAAREPDDEPDRPAAA